MPERSSKHQLSSQCYQLSSLRVKDLVKATVSPAKRGVLCVSHKCAASSYTEDHTPYAPAILEVYENGSLTGAREIHGQPYSR